MSEEQPMQHCCGPEHDVAFFDDFKKLMGKYPDLAGKYIVSCDDHETDILKIDFDTHVAVRKIEGRTIITEFEERRVVEGSPDTERPIDCCGWDGKKCTAYWV